MFNFDCIGFTGTPFIDNYPTAAYIRSQRIDTIPDLIDRSFYAYTSDALSQAEFEQRFACFQAKNSNVLVEYVSSDFVQDAEDELAILSHIFEAQAQMDGRPSQLQQAGAAGEAMDLDVEQVRTQLAGAGVAQEEHGFNVLVDLCGIFKKTSIFEVRDLVLQHFGPDRFHYIYHIDQTDGSDRVLYLNSDNDVQFDEEFYKFLCKSYGAQLREKIFFFVDNRNVIGKDVPFQLIFQRQFSQPLFFKSVVLAHDVDDFSKIWQAMGRSRTMNDTQFTIYKSELEEEPVKGMQDIKMLPLTRQLYVRNCDCKMAGNLSSIYQTLISLLNLAKDSFYYCDEIVNLFIEKMENTITDKLRRHKNNLAREVLGTCAGTSFLGGILMHILGDKFQKSPNPELASLPLTPALVLDLLGHIVQQKYEQRGPSGDIHDKFIRFLSGEQEGLMEISYTKQQQKTKQRERNKNQDQDTMEMFSKNRQLDIARETDNYFEYTLNPQGDLAKIALNLPICVPIVKLRYALNGAQHYINVYPTVQFLYSHHIREEYITPQVKDAVSTIPTSATDTPEFCEFFLSTADKINSTGTTPPPAPLPSSHLFETDHLWSELYCLLCVCRSTNTFCWRFQ